MRFAVQWKIVQDEIAFDRMKWLRTEGGGGEMKEDSKGIIRGREYGSAHAKDRTQEGENG